MSRGTKNTFGWRGCCEWFVWLGWQTKTVTSDSWWIIWSFTKRFMNISWVILRSVIVKRGRYSQLLNLTVVLNLNCKSSSIWKHIFRLSRGKSQWSSLPATIFVRCFLNFGFCFSYFSVKRKNFQLTKKKNHVLVRAIHANMLEIPLDTSANATKWISLKG